MDLGYPWAYWQAGALGRFLAVSADMQRLSAFSLLMVADAYDEVVHSYYSLMVDKSTSIKIQQQCFGCNASRCLLNSKTLHNFTRCQSLEARRVISGRKVDQTGMTGPKSGFIAHLHLAHLHFAQLSTRAEKGFVIGDGQAGPGLRICSFVVSPFTRHQLLAQYVSAAFVLGEPAVVSTRLHHNHQLSLAAREDRRHARLTGIESDANLSAEAAIRRLQ